MYKALIGSALLALALVVQGCISNTKYGTEITDAVAPNAGEGEVIQKHGCPDAIVYLGTAWQNPATGEKTAIDKYLFEYRIGGGSTILLDTYSTDKFWNICYLISGGKVQGGGHVAEGGGTIILNGWYLHPKVRAGYGGDGTPSGAPINLMLYGMEKQGLLGLGIGPF